MSEEPPKIPDKYLPQITLPQSMRQPVRDDAPVVIPRAFEESLMRFSREEAWRARERERLEAVRAAAEEARLAARERRETYQHVARMVFSVIGNTIFWGSLALFLGIGLSQVLDRTPPMENVVSIVTPVVHAGQQLKMRVEPYRLRACETKTTFLAYDGERAPKTVVLDWSYPRGPLGPDVPFERPITIPRDAAPGPAGLRIERQFRCPLNIVHRLWPIIEVSPEIPFTILPPLRESSQ